MSAHQSHLIRDNTKKEANRRFDDCSLQVQTIDSEIYQDFIVKLDKFIVSQTSLDGLELSMFLKNADLARQILHELEKSEGYGRQIDTNSIEALSASAVAVCSESLRKLAVVTDFNIDHFKKSVSYYAQLVSIVQINEFTAFAEFVCKSIVSVLPALLSLINKTPTLKYDNQEALTELLALLIVVAMNLGGCFTEINQFLFQNRSQLLPITAKANDLTYTHSPGILSAYEKFRLAKFEDKSPIELTKNVFPYGGSSCVASICECLPQLEHILRALDTDEVGSTVDDFHLFVMKSDFHRELFGLFVFQHKDIIVKIEALDSDNFTGQQVKLLLRVIAGIFLGNHIYEERVIRFASEFERELFSSHDKSLEWGLRIITEVVDHDLSLLLEEHTGLVHTLMVSLNILSDSLKSNKDYLFLHEVAAKSGLSLPSLLSHLNFLLIKFIFKSDVFATIEPMPLPDSISENFISDVTLPLPKSNFIFEKSPFGSLNSVSKGVRLIKTLLDCERKATHIRDQISHHISTKESVDVFGPNDNQNASLSFKMKVSFIDVELSSLLATEILIYASIQRSHTLVSDSHGLKHNLKYFCDEAAESNNSLMENLIASFGPIAMYCLIKNMINTCLSDLQCVDVCAMLLERLWNHIPKMQEYLKTESLCQSSFVQFLELFGDPSLSTFKTLYNGVTGVDATPSERISFSAKEYQDFLKENFSEFLGATGQSQDNVFAEMNISRVPNFEATNTQDTVASSDNTNRYMKQTTASYDLSQSTYSSARSDAVDLAAMNTSLASSDAFEETGENFPHQFAPTEKSYKFQHYTNMLDPNLMRSGAAMYDQQRGTRDSNAANFGGLSGAQHSSLSPTSSNFSDQYSPNVLQGYKYTNQYSPQFERGPSFVQTSQSPNTSRAQSIHVDIFERGK